MNQNHENAIHNRISNILFGHFDSGHNYDYPMVTDPGLADATALELAGSRHLRT